MKSFIAWWYQISLPKRGPDTTPAERERSRYARLTSTFSLVIFVLSLLTTVYGVLTSINPAAPVIEVIGFLCVLASLLCNKLGYNQLAALLLILNTTIVVVGNLLTNPLDPAFATIFCALAITVILAGSLMPPVFALWVGAMNCAIIVLVAIFQPHTAEYDHLLAIGYGSIVIALPIALQIIVAVVIYVIMNNLIATIRRADRAEEIVALQKEVVEYQRRRAQEQKQLEEGITAIAQVYTAVANGDLEARVPLGSESVLWQVAVPLNNLLNRVQHWKRNSDQWEKTLLATRHVIQAMQQAREQHMPVVFQHPTGTPLDALLPEVNYLSQLAFRFPPPRP